MGVIIPFFPAASIPQAGSCRSHHPHVDRATSSATNCQHHRHNQPDWPNRRKHVQRPDTVDGRPTLPARPNRPVPPRPFSPAMPPASHGAVVSVTAAGIPATGSPALCERDPCGGSGRALQVWVACLAGMLRYTRTQILGGTARKTTAQAGGGLDCFVEVAQVLGTWQVAGDFAPADNRLLSNACSGTSASSG